MRILIFNFEYPPLGGGGGVATAEFAQELSQRHEVVVITSRFKSLPVREQHGRLLIERVPVLGRRKHATASIVSLLSFVPTALWYGWRLSSRARFDVMNAQFVVPSGIPAALLARFTHTPLVISFIGGDIYDPTKSVSPHRYWVFRALVRWLSRQAVQCTAISTDTRERAIKLHGVTTPIVVTPLGYTPRVVQPLTRAQLNLPAAAPVAISIGRLIPRKCFASLIAAWRDIPEAHLVIVGSGPLKPQLQALIAHYQLTDRVHILGFVPEERKYQLLQTASLYVSAAEHEGFGIVFLEAMAAGLPIVATDNGGQTDFLQHERNALLVPAHNAATLTQAITRLLTDITLQKHLRASNLADVTNYTVAAATRTLENVLMRATQQRL